MEKASRSDEAMHGRCDDPTLEVLRDFGARTPQSPKDFKHEVPSGRPRQTLRSPKDFVRATTECLKLIEKIKEKKPNDPNDFLKENNSTERKIIQEIYQNEYFQNLYKYNSPMYLAVYQYCSLSDKTHIHFKLDK